ncbi:hypothetical protein ACP70R_007931 [Stipagrostis hirtigluma subsp. patula]
MQINRWKAPVQDHAFHRSEWLSDGICYLQIYRDQNRRSVLKDAGNVRQL